MVPQPRGERVKQKVPSLAYQYGARYERKVMMDIRRSEEPKGDATGRKATLITVKKKLLNCSCGRCSREDVISHRQLKRSWYSELVPASNLTLRWFHKATVNQNLVQYLGTKVTTQPLHGSQHDLQLQTDESLYLHKA
jgi:hypothetical protein